MWPFNRFKKKKPSIPRSSTVITLPGEMVRITLCETTYFTEKEMGKTLDAICILSYVLNSDEFFQRTMNATFTTTKLSNQSIYNIIMNSNEGLDGSIGSFGMDHGNDDKEVDLVLSMYSARFSRVVGYTLPQSVRVYLNRKFFTWFKAWNVAGNLFHEHSHNLGFDHSSASDANSVPYLFGDIVAELGEKYADVAIATRRPLIETHVRVGGL